MRSFVLLCLSALLAVAGAAVAGYDGKVRVVTGHSKAAQCIAPVRVNKIDGKEVYVTPLEFQVEPGKHTVSASAKVDTRFCQTVGTSSNRYTIEPIEVDFEQGKTYYLGYDHSSHDRNDWKLVIWKVEDEKD